MGGGLQTWIWKGDATRPSLWSTWLRREGIVHEMIWKEKVVGDDYP